MKEKWMCRTKLAHILISSRRLFVDIAVIYYHQNLHFSCTVLILVLIIVFFFGACFVDHGVLSTFVRSVRTMPTNCHYYLDRILSERNVTYSLSLNDSAGTVSSSLSNCNKLSFSILFRSVAGFRDLWPSQKCSHSPNTNAFSFVGFLSLWHLHE